MNQRRIFGGGLALILLVTVAVACRRGEPTGDPKTPPNSPLPEIDRKDEDPKAPPPLRVGDAG